MTAAFLQSELASLIQDSKRRQSDVRTTAEKSLADLKAIQVTSETQLAGDLFRRPQFIEPFILACNSKHFKLAVTGAICLQRLIASKAIAPSRLADILDAFQEAAKQGLDVQLKILQALPSFLQLYAIELQGEALTKILSLCASLAGNKTALVSTTAVATFQQLIAALFEKQVSQAADDENDQGDSDDIANVFNDICMVVRGEQPQLLKPEGFTSALALEMVELMLSNSNFMILDLPSCLATCEEFLVPGIISILEKSISFSTFGRCLRTLYLLITRELERMLDSISDALSAILHLMDRPSGPPWRRILCLEFMRSITSNYQLFRTVFAIFDCDENRKGIVRDLMAILVRIAAEDPALIGLGRQSTIPTNSENDDLNTGNAHVDIDAVGNVLQASSNVTGISSKWSTLTNPLLEQLDRQTAPEIPETYIYTLVLGCVASFSDGLSKFIMPLSVPTRASLEVLEAADSDSAPTRKNSQVRRAEKYQRLLNPLKRDDVPGQDEIEICAKVIEQCWPAVLATCSTFLNSALDSYFYHILVRTVQKLAQVSGVLELFTPRDALLTTLAKVSVPLNASSIVTALYGNKLAKTTVEDDQSENEEAFIKSAITNTPRPSVDFSRQPLNVRNLLCLRALLNLGIALGPTLNEASWFIIVQALQQADALMSVSPTIRASTSKPQSQDEIEADGQTKLGSEITAVGTASKRMLESTRTYSDETLEVFLRSVFKMVDTLFPVKSQQPLTEDSNSNTELTVRISKHKATRSVSGALSTSSVLQVEVEFVLKTVNDLARVNLHRFCSVSSRSCTWDFITTRLLSLVADNSIDAQIRLKAANILDTVSVESIRTLEKQDKDAADLELMQNLCLDALKKQLSLLYLRESVPVVLSTDVDIHRRLLEALENIVSNSGETLTSGWRTVFDILQKTTRQSTLDDNNSTAQSNRAEVELVLERTIPPAFRTVQLIVSDFLSVIDPLSFSVLVRLLPSFGSQKNDLNISLTTTVLFSNLSSLLLERTDSVDVSMVSDGTQTTEQNNSITHGREGVDVSSLWFAIVLQLCLLCKDDRSDVRNSALRVLIRVLESSGPQLTPLTWNVAFREAIFPVLDDYCKPQNQGPAWHASYTQLLVGFVELFVQNVSTVTSYDDFVNTWKALVSVFTVKLKEQSLEGHSVIFSSAAQLLQILPQKLLQDREYLDPLLQFWSEDHPATIAIEEKSNQDAICAHVQLFTAITEKAVDTVQDTVINDKSLTDIAMIHFEQALLKSVHPPYSSDVTKLGSEQTAVFQNLEILRAMMKTEKREHSSFLLSLIDKILTRNITTESEHQDKVKDTKSLKRPTLVAFMSQCITLFRKIIRDEATNPDMCSSTSAELALRVLTKVTETKYTNIPSGNGLPAWQNGTEAIVELMEAVQSYTSHLTTELIERLSLHIVDALRAILTAPALESTQPQPSSSNITSDETADIASFASFHTAAIPLLRLSSFPPSNRTKYMTTLFRASLTAKPWFRDLPNDLETSPLSDLAILRPGSIRPPDFYPRTQIPYEATTTLFSLVDATTDPNPLLASTAAPYVILRIAHTLKVFQSDQKLRNLIPPPVQIQRELNFILNHALNLRVVDAAFAGLLTSGRGYEDGKTHLRILYPLVLRFKEFWDRLPRLRICAWQDGEDGVAVKKVLDRWGGVLTEGWGLGI